MPKLITNLIGRDITGRLGKTLTFYTVNGQTRVRTRVTPTDHRTESQVAQRTTFQAGIEFWYTLTNAQKEEYRLLDPRSGFNAAYLNFMSLWLRGEVSYDRGEGSIWKPYTDYSAIIQGIWTESMDGTVVFQGRNYNWTHNDGDEVEYLAYLDAGTYFLRILAITDTGQGILDIAIDDVVVATFDTYSNPRANNVELDQANIVIATPGIKTITFRVDGKNPSSTDHYVSWMYFSLWRTP